MVLGDINKQVDPQKKWENLQSIGMVESIRTVDGKTTVQTRYYISTLPNNAQILGQSVRSHWGIENPLHWGGVSAGEAFAAQPPLLDVAFCEDNCRIRKDNAS